jgi:predicted DNA-binding ribbon-helix-helix protein
VGRKTGVSLEPQFWAALEEIATERGMSMSALVTGVHADRGNANLSSAIRVFVLRYYQDRRNKRSRSA